MAVPNSIILDTHVLVKQLRSISQNIQILEGRHFIVDILEDIMFCLRSAVTAKSYLAEFVNEIRSGRYEYGYTLLNTELANVVEELGLHLFEQLKHYGIYLPDGTVSYHYCTVTDPHFHDVLMIKTHELS
jgi:hypothetical protein